MWDGFIGNLIRRTNQRLLITALLFLAGIAAFFGYNHRYFYGFFAGPRPVTAQQLTAAPSAAAFANPFVTLTDESATTTNLEEMHTEDGRESETAAFESVVVGGHHLLVRVAPDAFPAADSAAPLPAGALTGQIKRLDDVRNSVYGHYATAEGDLLPIYLDTYDYREFGYISLAIGLPLLLFSLYLLWRWWQVSSDFTRYPLCRKLAKQGQLELLIQQIDSEMAAPHTTFSGRGTRADVSRHWLVISHFMGGVAMQLSNIVWVHRSLVKRRIYFVITISKRHLVNVYDLSGQKAALQLAEAKAAEFFEHLRNVTPQAVHGYDKRLLSLWKRTPDKAGFPAAAAAMLSGQTLPDQRVTNQYGG